MRDPLDWEDDKFPKMAERDAGALAAASLIHALKAFFFRALVVHGNFGPGISQKVRLGVLACMGKCICMHGSTKPNVQAIGQKVKEDVRGSLADVVIVRCPTSCHSLGVDHFGAKLNV